MSIEYAVQIVWSTEDGAYIAMSVELPGCMADGQTQEEALANFKVAVLEWIEVAREDGRDIPQPASVQDMARAAQQAHIAQQQQIQDFVQKAVEKTVAQVIEKITNPPPVTGWGEYQTRDFYQAEGVFVKSGGHRSR